MLCLVNLLSNIAGAKFSFNLQSELLKQVEYFFAVHSEQISADSVVVVAFTVLLLSACEIHVVLTLVILKVDVGLDRELLDVRRDNLLDEVQSYFVHRRLPDVLIELDLQV